MVKKIKMVALGEWAHELAFEQAAREPRSIGNTTNAPTERSITTEDENTDELASAH